MDRSYRQTAILDVARKIFRERGYLGLNMDRVAQEMKVAKGTIYQHFSCKEEIPRLDPDGCLVRVGLL